MNIQVYLSLQNELKVMRRIVLEHARTIKALCDQNEVLEEALKDADNEIVRLAEMLQIAYRRLNMKTYVLRFPQVFLSVKRKIARNNSTYTGVENVPAPPMVPIPPT